MHIRMSVMSLSFGAFPGSVAGKKRGFTAPPGHGAAWERNPSPSLRTALPRGAPRLTPGLLLTRLGRERAAHTAPTATAQPPLLLPPPHKMAAGARHAGRCSPDRRRPVDATAGVGAAGEFGKKGFQRGSQTPVPISL